MSLETERICWSATGSCLSPPLRRMTGLESLRSPGDTEVTAGSGVLLSRLAAFAQEHGLTGLEFAHGIPGTLGGAVTMNAGGMRRRNARHSPENVVS